MRRITGKGIKTAGITLATFIAAGTIIGSGAVFAAEEDNIVVTENPELTNKSSPENKIDPDVSNRDVISESTEKDGKQMSGTSLVQADAVENVGLQEKEGDDKDKAEVPSDEQEVKNGWVYENGAYKYYKDGTAYTGWHKMGKAEGETTPHWSYFDKDGVLYTGWHIMGKKEGEGTQHWSYFGDNGWLRTGWKKLDKKDGEATPHWSYFGDNGWMRTGWKYLGTADGEAIPHWSYFGDNGWMRTGWQYLDKKDGEKTPHWSYFGDNGWMRTGWQSMGKGTSNPDGGSAKHWSYFGTNGWLRTGLQTMGTSANPDGNTKQHLSYFGGNGWLVENKIFTYENRQYIADPKGWVTAVKTDHEKTLVRAMELVAKITNAGMTKEQKLRASYDHIKDNYPEYNPRIPHTSDKGWHILYANDIFVGQNGKKGGNCFSTAAALAYMAKAIGYEDVYAISVNGHGWTEINGLVYDAERERHHKGSYYALSYDTPIGTQDALEQYQWIFTAKNPYAKVKI